MILLAITEVVVNQSLPGCPNKCGDVEIPYPFGVGHQSGTGNKCFLEEETFSLSCDENSKLWHRNVEISSISVRGHMDMSMNVSRVCYDGSGRVLTENAAYLTTPAFTISSKENKFTSVGCDTYGYILGSQSSGSAYGSYATGCLTKCNTIPNEENAKLNSNSCSGIGCCTVDIPLGMRNITSQAYSFNNHAQVWDFNNCSYAFVAKREWFNFSLDFLDYLPYSNTPLVVDWTIPNGTCESAEARSDYACTSNTRCVDSNDGFGYNCRCLDGFEGNPYHPDGCHDIDECSIKNNCSKTCQNIYGISVALLFVITLVFLLCWVHKRRTLKQLRRRNFEQNGGTMLQGYGSMLEGYGDRTKIFAEVELKTATKNFDESRILGRGGQGTVYKGILPDNTLVAIKKSRAGADPRQIKDFINEVAVLSQINHRNVVKLLGCCLETDAPLLVYEFVDNGTLLDHIDPLKSKSPIPWDTRLRIAAETAEAISYLHSAASIPIIHRDIKSTNILLDHNHRAKVSDFGASRLVPLDETQVTTVVQGTLGYLDPEYLHTGQLNEKSDVYSFGVVLVELLTGNKAVEFNRPEQKNLAMYFVSSMKEDRLWEILDSQVLEQEKNAEQLKGVALLARKCLRVNGEERPTMKEVAIELDGLIAMEKHPSVKGEDSMLDENENENKSILGNVNVLDGYDDASASNSAGYDSIQKQIPFEIADGR
ncbi:putative wall-associated receptor kinase-like 16 [Senna tora]|uniref:Putative wall-associated receptor kinase-like 16 n=1 Tax=Senna tora TaxID=362788 RepID=A0A834T805_9FABA|nr:putative wall-associated receptor kinase-like 16 [Senna tora]